VVVEAHDKIHGLGRPSHLGQPPVLGAQRMPEVVGDAPEVGIAWTLQALDAHPIDRGEYPLIGPLVVRDQTP
jgi:hypothetical protein